MVTTWTQAVLTIIACSAIAGLWAVFRPDLVRDNDGRRLPYSLTARVAFTVLFVFSYLAMAAAFLFGGFFIKSLSELMGPVPKFLHLAVQPRDQFFESELIGPDAVERGERAVQHVVPAVELARALHREQIGDRLDHADDPGVAAQFHYERGNRLALFRDPQPLGSGALGGGPLPVRIVRPCRRMGRMVLAPGVSTSLLP